MYNKISYVADKLSIYLNDYDILLETGKEQIFICGISYNINSMDIYHKKYIPVEFDIYNNPYKWGWTEEIYNYTREIYSDYDLNSFINDICKLDTFFVDKLFNYKIIDSKLQELYQYLKDLMNTGYIIKVNDNILKEVYLSSLTLILMYPENKTDYIHVDDNINLLLNSIKVYTLSDIDVSKYILN